MKVDFNAVRRRALSSYTGLVNVLNDRLSEGYVTVPAAEVKNHLDTLRNALVTIGLCHQPDDPDIVDVLGDGKVPVFAAEEDHEQKSPR